MKLPCVRSLGLGAVLGIFAVSLAFSGCSKKNILVLDNSVFSSAPPELRENWKAAAQSIAGNDYLGGATNLMVLLNKTQQLSAAQNEAVNQAWTQLGNQAFEAANKGDKAATEAVLKMRESKGDDRRGR